MKVRVQAGKCVDCGTVRGKKLYAKKPVSRYARLAGERSERL